MKCLRKNFYQSVLLCCYWGFLFSADHVALAEEPLEKEEQPLLLICVARDFAIQLKAPSGNSCHWVVLDDMRRERESVWDRFFAVGDDPLPDYGRMLIAAALEAARKPTPKENIAGLPTPAQLLLDFQILEDEQLMFYREGRTPLNWHFRRLSGMTGPYFTESYMDNPLRRVGLRLRLDY